MKEEVLNVSPSTVAQALAADYFCIYYVNFENDKFIEYSASPEYRNFGLPSIGDDFSTFSRERFEELIHPDDRVLFLETFTKEHVLEAMDTYGHFTMTFRMMFGNGPIHVHLKMTKMIEEQGQHVVVGISSVDDQMKAREAFEAAHSSSITYSRVAQALARDYFSIYVVDPDTDRFVEYSATEEYRQLGFEKSGEDFFDLSRRNIDKIIHPEDRDRFMAVFTKERIMQILERDGSFTTKYRLMIGGQPVYVSMKASLLEDQDGRHLIFGANNIDAQMKREEEYRRRMAEARNKARNDFLANMSHDIRTPMNAIVGYTNIARSHLDDPEIVKDSLEKISSSNHFLLSLINDVLDMSKIESGKMQLTIGDCDLAAVFRRIEDITSMQARSKALQIRYDHEKVRHYRVCGDELRIEQVLINIVSNAIKYTPEGQTVELTAREDEPYRYTFVIRDTGIGISEEYLPYLFESFTREQNTLVNRVQGTGLGLAITARIVELMGGTISVKSRLGEGSVFTVEVGLEPPEDESGPGQEAEEGSCGTDAQAAAQMAGRRILLVEDNEINAEIAVMILSHAGIEVDRAENGRTGFEKVRDAGEGYYSAVLMDIQMPVMNGNESARAIRSLPGDYFRDLPIIAMSANAYEEDVRDCLEAGMNAHIAKPFEPDKLLALLSKYTGKR